MSRTDIKKQVNRGLAWISAASSVVGLFDIAARAIVIHFFIEIEDYGVVMIAAGLFPALDLITDLGITAALIQRDDHSEEKINTVFWLNVIMSLVVFAALALGVGPLLAWIHEQPVVAGLLALYGSKLIWQNVYFIPSALMQRELRFKELSVLRILANCAEFGSIVGSAAAGAGIWCFVIGPLARVAVTGVGTQILYPWRPRLVLEIREAADWLFFGFKTSLHKLLFQLYTNLDYQFVPYFFGAEAAGLYGVAYQLVLEPCRVIAEVVNKIGFPAFARLKHHRDKLVDQLVSFTRMNLVIMLGFLGAVLVAAPEILSLIFGEDYAAASTAARILCAVGVLRALSFVVPPLLDGLGKPTLTVIYTAVASVVIPVLFYLSAILLGPSFGYLSIAIGWAIGYPIAFVVLFALALRQLDLSVSEYARPLLKLPLLAAVATGAGLAVHFGVTDFPPLVRLIASVGMTLFVFGVLLARFEGISPRSVAESLRG